MLDDPQAFLNKHQRGRIVLDEIHRLDNPTEILKIAADHYPDIRVLATGSSTLGASAKFKDTLTGRKAELWLTPMVLQDLADFGRPELEHRFLHGGLPPFFLSKDLPEYDFQEWMDAFWARDIQELFRLERRHSFQKFAELILAQSGGIFEASSFAPACEVSRTTITNYLAVLEATFVAHVIHPFSSRRPREIVAAPKVYGFDTGFVCYHRGWNSLRREDMGLLWEHFVLNEIYAHAQSRQIRYWRDKSKHEVDFVLPGRGRSPTVVECKWTAGSFDPSSLKAFRRRYPKGKNVVVASDVDRSFEREYDGISVQFISLPELIKTVLNVS
jgi:predicted AAA+ superfamily ATPase